MKVTKDQLNELEMVSDKLRYFNVHGMKLLTKSQISRMSIEMDKVLKSIAKLNMIILFILCIPVVTSAQLNKNIWKASIIQGAAGFVDGTNQAYLFHYDQTDKFKKWGISPNEEAWKNKWAKDPNGNVIVGKERFFLSSTSLVFLTDFHHSTRFAYNRLNEATALTYAFGNGAKIKKWYWYAADFAIMFAARSVGFTASYDFIFK